MTEPTPADVAHRLRVFDLSTRWFWLVVFYQREYGRPIMEASLFGPTPRPRWWLHVWLWEPVPSPDRAWEVAREETP
jgi:hypothetical protein